MSLWKRGGWYWTDFSIDGVRYRKPPETRNWQEAKKAQREMIEDARKGQLGVNDHPKTYFSGRSAETGTRIC